MRDIRVPQGTPGQRYQAPSMRLGRSQFDLSRNHKTTFDASYLIPYFVDEVIPGDTHVVKLTALVRVFSPLDAPIMDDIEVDVDFFYVPNRLLWTNWHAFLGAHDDAGAQDTEYTIPVLATGLTVTTSSLAHYMGVPVNLQSGSVDVNALPFRAYRLVYNEWYRDQSLIDSIDVDLTDGPTPYTHAQAVVKSAKKADYFTTALPYLQKGDASQITLGSVYVQVDGGTGTYPAVYSTTASEYRQLGEDGAGTSQLLAGSQPATYALYANLPAISINALREAAAVQRLLERDARGGTRPNELIRAHFGVDVPDYRIQRPEYLGGGRGYINVSPVANQSGTGNQGELAGVGVGTLRASFAKSFVEHGYIIGILRARGALSYSQGLHRMWSRSTKYDFLWPELAHLGEQSILNKELYVQNAAADDDVFGYQERYAEYRYGKSLVTGKFAVDATGSLSIWHLSEDFASAPALNQTFVEDQTPMARVTTVDTEPDFIVDGRFDHKVARALPVRPVPSLAPARF